MTIKQLTEIVNGSLTPSNQKLDADLIEISSTSGNALQVSEDGILVDVSQLATKTELADAIANVGTGGSSPEPEWTLTNATLSNGYLTYTGGTYEEEGLPGDQQIGLFAKKSLKIGESVTVDFKTDATKISSITLAVDDGTKSGSYGDNGAVIFQNGLEFRLISGRDWLDEYKVILNEGYEETAQILRISSDTIVLSQFSAITGNLMRSRTVKLEGVDLNRVWFTVKLVSESTLYNTKFNTTKPLLATEQAVNNKVDKEAGKVLSTNDFTTELKDKLEELIPAKAINMNTLDGSVSSVFVREQGDYINYMIDTPSVGKQMRTLPKEFVSPSKVNSVPLYSLDNDGEFVLTEPDTWVSFNDSNFVFPVYHVSTIDTTFLKGIVTLSAEMGADGEGNPTLDFNYTHNVRDVIDGYELYINPTSLFLDTTKLPHVFTSSVEGETVFGTIKVPLTYEEFGYSLQQAINDLETDIFSLRFELALTSGGKRTVQVRAVGIYKGAQS